MAIYYKFKSERGYDSIPIYGPFIQVGILKAKIVESKRLGDGEDYDIVLTNAQTYEDYVDEAALIYRNTYVLIRRVPGPPCTPIVIGQELTLENKVENSQPDKANCSIGNSSALKHTKDDISAVPQVIAAQSSTTLPNDTTDEEHRIQDVVGFRASEWQGAYGFGVGGRGYRQGMGGRGFGMKWTPPPHPGYVCHRCNVPGHLIQHCPTNGDPSYDVRWVKPPIGVPKFIPMANPERSYALPSGAAAVGLDGFMGGYGYPMPPDPLNMAFGGVKHPGPLLSQGFGLPGIPPHSHRDVAVCSDRHRLERVSSERQPSPLSSIREYRKRSLDPYDHDYDHESKIMYNDHDDQYRKRSRYPHHHEAIHYSKHENEREKSRERDNHHGHKHQRSEPASTSTSSSSSTEGRRLVLR